MKTPITSPAEQTTGNVPEASRVPVPSGYKDGVRYRQRVAGTGYGRSSGYARERTYADSSDGKIFNFG